MPSPLVTLADRWATARPAERANAQSYVIELCRALDVDPPAPAGSGYEFEYAIKVVARDGTEATNFVDCYKARHFALEAKDQEPGGSDDRLLRRAFGQVRNYVGHLPDVSAAVPAGARRRPHAAGLGSLVGRLRRLRRGPAHRTSGPWPSGRKTWTCCGTSGPTPPLAIRAGTPPSIPGAHDPDLRMRTSICHAFPLIRQTLSSTCRTASSNPQASTSKPGERAGILQTPAAIRQVSGVGACTATSARQTRTSI